MDCEFCAMEGMANDAVRKCTECGEWVCEEHIMLNALGDPLCPTCFEDADDETQDLEQDIKEVD